MNHLAAFATIARLPKKLALVPTLKNSNVSQIQQRDGLAITPPAERTVAQAESKCVPIKIHSANDEMSSHVLPSLHFGKGVKLSTPPGTSAELVHKDDVACFFR